MNNGNENEENKREIPTPILHNSLVIVSMLW